MLSPQFSGSILRFATVSFSFSHWPAHSAQSGSQHKCGHVRKAVGDNKSVWTGEPRPREIVVPVLYLDWQLDIERSSKSIEARCYFHSSVLLDSVFLSCSESFTEENSWQLTKIVSSQRNLSEDIAIPCLILPVKLKYNAELCLRKKTENLLFVRLC